MDLTQIISQLQGQLGDKVDLSQIKSASDLGKLTDLLKGVNLPAGAQDIVAKLTNGGNVQDILTNIAGGAALGDLDGDGKQESLSEELMGKAQQVLGGLFGGK